MTHPLANKTALITGSSQRMGKAIAIELAQMGMEVIIHYRNSQEQARKTVAEIFALGGRCYSVQADIAHYDQVEKMLGQIQKRSGKIDILINNVGAFLMKNITELQPTEWDSILQSTLHCTYYMCHAIIPGMLSLDYARIINICDSGADYIKPWLEVTPYMIGKTGILTLTKSLATAYAHSNLTVNCLSPGILEDTYGERPPINNRYGKYQDINNGIQFLLQPQSSYITGSNLKISGGWSL